jgi:hypothetical protein
VVGWRRSRLRLGAGPGAGSGVATDSAVDSAVGSADGEDSSGDLPHGDSKSDDGPPSTKDSTQSKGPNL